MKAVKVLVDFGHLPDVGLHRRDVGDRMIRRFLAALASRGEMPDPVDDHYATVAAALCPDALPDPGWCDCTDQSQPCNHEES